MRKSTRYVGALAAVQLAACSAEPAVDRNVVAQGETPSAVAPQAQEKLVLAFGDSLYAGYGVDASQSFPAVLERQLEAAGVPAKVVNAGVSGDTSGGGARRLAFTLDGLERTPDLAIVGLGANDMLRGIDPAETRRNLDAIFAELKKRGIPIVITGMLAPRNYGADYVARFEPIYPELAKKYNAVLDPFFLDGVITRSDLLLPDGLHPNPKGIEVMAKRLAPIVTGELREGR
jgi:acyl-CoA thioesterase I